MKKATTIFITGMILMTMLICSTYAAADDTPYVNASSWAVPELDQASIYGFIAGSISEDMKKSVSREEMAELAVRLYEKYTGQKAAAADYDTFRDTKNPEVLKAYELDIVQGTDRFWRLFSPEATATREQVAVMLYRTINAMYPDATIYTNGEEQFSDQEDISDWAVEAVDFMSSNGLIKGRDGRIYPGETCSREMAVIMALRIYEKYKVNNDEYLQEDQAEVGYKQLLINDILISSDNYSSVEKGDKSYILIAADKFKYAFKQPNSGYYTYPEVNIFGSSISITWNSTNGKAAHVEMQANNTEALLNDIKVDMGVAPYSKYGKMFIPIDFLITERRMVAEERDKNGILYIQYDEDFPKESLIGSWSDSNHNILENIDVITEGTLEPTAFSTGYRFNADGTYSHSMASILKDVNDTLILEKGQYRISGNTILCYDVTETVYKGYPLALQHADKARDTSQYLFIYNYEPQNRKIEIGGFWLNKF